MSPSPFFGPGSAQQGHSYIAIQVPSVPPDPLGLSAAGTERMKLFRKCGCVHYGRHVAGYPKGVIRFLKVRRKDKAIRPELAAFADKPLHEFVFRHISVHIADTMYNRKAVSSSPQFQVGIQGFYRNGAPFRQELVQQMLVLLLFGHSIPEGDGD